MAWFSSANLHFVYFHQIVLGKELKRDNLWWWMLTWCNVFSHICWSRNFRYLNFRVPSYIPICSKIWPYLMILNILIDSQSFFKIFFYDLSHQKKGSFYALQVFEFIFSIANFLHLRELIIFFLEEIRFLLCFMSIILDYCVQKLIFI